LGVNQKHYRAINQYASPLRGNAIPAGLLSEFFFTKLGEGVSQAHSSNFTVVMYLSQTHVTLAQSADNITKIVGKMR